MASLRLEPKHLGVQSSERFPGRHLLDRMQAADPGNIRCPIILPVLQSNLTTQLGEPAGWLNSCKPAHSTFPTSLSE